MLCFPVAFTHNTRVILTSRHTTIHDFNKYPAYIIAVYSPCKCHYESTNVITRSIVHINSTHHNRFSPLICHHSSHQNSQRFQNHTQNNSATYKRAHIHGCNDTAINSSFSSFLNRGGWSSQLLLGTMSVLEWKNLAFGHRGWGSWPPHGNDNKDENEDSRWKDLESTSTGTKTDSLTIEMMGKAKKAKMKKKLKKLSIQIARKHSMSDLEVSNATTAIDSEIAANADVTDSEDSDSDTKNQELNSFLSGSSDNNNGISHSSVFSNLDDITYDQYQILLGTVQMHNDLYYRDDPKPIVSDETFDQMMKTLELLEAKNPHWATEDSPTQTVGHASTAQQSKTVQQYSINTTSLDNTATPGKFPKEKFQTHRHDIPMLSLSNTYSKEEVDQFLDRIETNSTCLELKIDGLAVSVIYKNRKVHSLVTRGDGRVGEDVTPNLNAVKGIIPTLPSDAPDEVEIRGEVCISNHDFRKMNDSRISEGLQPFSNPRNTAAGSLKLLDPKEAQTRNLTFLGYEVIIKNKGSPDFEYQSEALKLLQKWGIMIIPMWRKCLTREEIFSFIDEVEKVKSKLPYIIDGVVIKADSISLKHYLGNTAKSPRSAVAYKFPALGSKTRVKDIIVQVSRSSILTPVALLEPVQIGGVTVSRATLHNINEVQRLDIRVGDVVAVYRAGDVIPKITEVDFSARETSAKVWTPPSKCPNCQAKVKKVKDPVKKDEYSLKCSNAECTGQAARKLIHFASKGSMDIKGLGPKIIEKLMSAELVLSPIDLYQLTPQVLQNVDGFKEKSALNLIEAIEGSKKTEMWRFITALGIPGVGTTMAQVLAKTSSDNFENLLQLTKNIDKLMELDGVAVQSATRIQEFFCNPRNATEMRDLLNVGITFVETSSNVNSQATKFVSQVSGKSIVVTGALRKLGREEVKTLIEAHDGYFQTAVSKKTDYVVVGDTPGKSKLTQAKQLGIPTITEDEFDQYFKS